MFSEGNVLYFTPYHFTKGSVGKPANKYFIVIKDTGGDILLTSLPTSQDYIPSKYSHMEGCINDDTINVNCYKFPAKKIISACSKHGFPINTYIHGVHVEKISKSQLRKNYPNVGDYEFKFVLCPKILEDLKKCLKESASVKRGIKCFL